MTDKLLKSYLDFRASLQMEAAAAQRFREDNATIRCAIRLHVLVEL